MKKKIVSVLLVLCMVVSVCACSKTEGSNETISNEESIGVEDEINVENSVEDGENETESDRPDWLSYLYEDPFSGYSIWLTNVAYGADSKGYKCLGTAEERAELIFVTDYRESDEQQKEDIDMTKYQSSEDIFDLLAPNFNYGILGTCFTMPEYSVEIIETKIVNGIEMTRFEGQMKAVFDDDIVTFEYEYPFVAYGIAAKNTPVLVTCIDQSEDQRYHEEWLTKIDELVATFKDAE